MKYFRNNFETNIDQGDSFDNCHSSPCFRFFFQFSRFSCVCSIKISFPLTPLKTVCFPKASSGWSHINIWFS